jgi:S-adenosylmethionine uptake transporter
MVARSGRSNPPSTIVFYFCLVGIVLHLAYFAWIVPHWPEGGTTWAWIGGSGLAATGAQLLMTRAYQHAPAALLGAVGYTGPVFSLGWSVLLFGQHPDGLQYLGCALVLGCGAALPLLIARAQSPGDAATGIR